jgi:hypothetical protein
MNHPIRRRRFATASAATGLLQVSRHVLGGSGYTPPGAKLNIAGIGLGGMGHANMLARTHESQTPNK